MFVKSLNDNVGNFHHRIKTRMEGDLCQNLQSMFYLLLQGPDPTVFDLNSPTTFTKHPGVVVR